MESLATIVAVKLYVTHEAHVFFSFLSTFPFYLFFAFLFAEKSRVLFLYVHGL